MPKRCDSRVNPSTGRCVLRKGSAGRHLRGRPSPCKATYNKITKRCRRSRPKTRPTSQKRSSSPKEKNNKTKAYSHIPKRFSTLVENAHELHRRWQKQKKIGGGCNGSVYRVCRDQSSKDCQYVIKVQRFNLQAKAELKAYLHLRSTGLTPRMHAAWQSGGKLYLVLDSLVPCRPQPRRAQVFSLLEKLERYGYLHVDTHIGNLMCSISKPQKPFLIDFGWSVHKDDEPFRRHPTGARCYEEMKEIQRENVLRFFR